MDQTPFEDGVRSLASPWYAILSLPNGVGTGFVTVMLGYVLTHNGVGVAAVAGLVSLTLLPNTWKFMMGPVLDMSLTSPRWYLIMVALSAISAAAFAIVPLNAHSLPILGPLCLILGASSTASGTAAVAAMAATTPNARRGGVAGWMQVGGLGGVGIGGGLSLWIATHGGGPKTAALALAGVCLVSAAPMLGLRPPRRRAGRSIGTQAKSLAMTLWSLVRTRRGVLVVLVQTLPAGLGAAGNLLPAVAGDWRASADLVAATTGVLGGLATLPGCVIGGYLCNHLPRRPVYIGAALACALGEAAMAMVPHTPGAFAAFVLGDNVLLGIAWASVSAAAYECLGETAAATVSSMLASLSCIPVVIVTALVGLVQTRAGSSAMLLTEAALGVASVAFYAVLATLWRPAATPALSPAAAPA